MSPGRNVQKGQAKLDKVQDKSDKAIKSKQRWFHRKQKVTEKPRKRVEKATSKTKPAQERATKTDTYRPMMKAKGDFKQDDRWNLSKMQIVLVLFMAVIIGIILAPLGICIAFVMIVVVMSLGGVKRTVQLIAWFAKLGSKLLKLMIKPLTWMASILTRLFRWLKKVWPF